LADVYRAYVRRVLDSLVKDGKPTIAALVIEPLVLGAAGMIFVDPLFQRVLVDVVRESESNPSSGWAGLPVIFDEVFVGLYRIGMESTAPLLGVNPDISVNAKILTGGLVPLAVTLASDSVFRSFWGESKVDSLLHGHSYTAHAIGCEVANETLKIIDDMASSEAWTPHKQEWNSYIGEPSKVWSFWSPHFVERVSKLPSVAEVMTLGTVLSIKFRDNDAGMQLLSFRCH
jgi:dethiobiotin synthetase/adenosylmethionine--8-amino-7-oxononanoate aminotransferase